MNKSLSRFVSIASASIFLFAQSAVLATPQDPSTAAPDIFPITDGSTGNSIFMGQNHKYYVIFRGNGEAIVYAGIEFTNTSDNVMTEFTFEAPTDLKDMTIFQYDQGRIINYQLNGITPEEQAKMVPYYGGSNLYSKVKFKQDQLKYTAKLAKAVMPNKNSHLLLGYTSRNFSSEFMGGFAYTFKSLKVDSRIEDLTVGITTDSGLFLKNANSTVAYTGASVSTLSSTNIAEKAVPNSDLDNIVSSLNGSGDIYKTYKQLSSGEVVSVDGEYSGTWVRLYAKEILIIVAIIALVIGGLIVLKIRLDKRKPAEKSNKPVNWIVTDIALGLVSAMLVTALSVIVTFSMSYYYDTAVSSSYMMGQYSPVVSLIFTLVVFLLYLLLTLTAPIYRAIKNGWASFAVTLFSEILFLTFFAVLFLLLLGTNTGAYPYAMPV